MAPGHVVPMDSIVSWLEHNGYNRSSTVREPGEYAVRGGILDLFPAGLDQPVRFDYFGDSLESIRSLRCGNPAHAARHALARSGADLGISTDHRNHPPLSHGLCRGLRRAGARRSAVRGGQRRPPPSRHGALAAAVFRERWTRCSTISATRRWRSNRKARTPRASASSRSRIITRRGARRWSIPAAARSTSRCRPTGSI